MARQNNVFINRTLNVLDLNKFNEEARALNSKIRVVLKLGEDQLRFNLSEALNVAEINQLNDFIAAYEDRNPEDSIPKIYDIVRGEARHKFFHNIDYIKDIKSGHNLIPVRTVVQGEVRQVHWYATMDAEQNPINKILKVEIQYTRDATGFAMFRTTTRTWINRDESENPEKKITQKFYYVNPSDMITEGYDRRKLLVQSLQIPIMNMMIEVLVPPYSPEAVVLKGRAFLDAYEELFAKFIEHSSTVTEPSDPNLGKKKVVVALEDNDANGFNKDFNEWLDEAPPSLGGLTTIRQYLIGEFSI